MLICFVSMYCFLIQLCFTLQFKLWIGPLLCLRGVGRSFFLCTTTLYFFYFLYTFDFSLYSSSLDSPFQFLSQIFQFFFSKWCSVTVYPFHDKFKSAFGIYFLFSYRQKKFPGFILIFPIWVFSMKSAQNSLKQILKNRHLIFKLCTTVPSTFSL